MSEELSEEQALAIVEGKTPVVEVVQAEKLPAKTLRDEIRDILVITFVCESRQLRGDSATLPIDVCLKIYRSNPLVFYYINKQLDHVMRAIGRHAKDQG